MIAASRFTRPASRTQALVEAVLAVLLLAQAPVWILTLGAPREHGDPGPFAAPSAPPPWQVNGDPFFAAVPEAALAPHTLYAVRAGAQPGAILAGPDGVQRAAGLGQAVSDGVTLAAVGPDHVILAHGGRRSRLDFPSAPPTVAVPPSPPTPAAPSHASGSISPGAAQAAIYETALRPVTSGGSTEGYVWRPGAEGGILAAMGLRAGDVLLRINGTPFDRHERLGELAADVEAGRPVEIEYRRNGSNYSARYAAE